MAELTFYERRYLEPIKGLDMPLVGEELGHGAQNIVREYGAEDVMKYARSKTRWDILSLTISRLLTQSSAQMEDDLAMFKEHFPGHAVATKVLTDTRKKSYCVLQPKITYADVTPELIADDSDLRDELAGVADANRALYSRKGKWFDIMGYDPKRMLAFKPYLANIVHMPDAQTDAAPDEKSTENKKLKVFDFALFPKPTWGLVGAYFKTLLEVQRNNLRGYGLELI